VFSRHRYFLWLTPKSWKGRLRRGHATIQYNSLERLCSSDFNDSPPVGRLTARESRNPATWSQIAYPESWPMKAIIREGDAISLVLPEMVRPEVAIGLDRS
jgi:hypothetical protein